MKKATQLWAAILIAATIGAMDAARADAADPSLRYFGYFASRITASGGDHLPEVAGRSNLNWVQISDPNRYAPEALDHCKPRGCIVSTGNEFFRGCDSEHSPSCELPELRRAVGPARERVPAPRRQCPSGPAPAAPRAPSLPRTSLLLELEVDQL
jgi:hypothetical protein